MTSPRWFFLACAGVLALMGTACGGGGRDGQGLSGTIQIDGSSTVQPFAQAAAELFQEENPDVRITVGGAGTGDGFERFCRGETEISTASREIEPQERRACKEGGVEPEEVQVANDGIAVVTNKDVAIECLTTEQLRELFGPGADARTFRDVGPNLSPRPARFFTPGEESGTFDFFTEAINKEEGAQRQQGVQTSADDNQLVTGIAGTPGGIGYFGYEFFAQNQARLNAVAVDGGRGCVRPSVETIQNGTYAPLSRALYLYPSKQALGRPEVREFLRFTVENAPRIAEGAKIVPLTPEQVSEARRSLAGTSSG